MAPLPVHPSVDSLGKPVLQGLARLMRPQRELWHLRFAETGTRALDLLAARPASPASSPTSPTWWAATSRCRTPSAAPHPCDTAPQFDTATPPNVEEIVSVLGAFSTPA